MTSETVLSIIVLTVRENDQRTGRFHAKVAGREVVTSRTPLLSAARALLAEGVPPETVLLMKHEGSDVVAMRTTVGAAAKLTVAERDRDSPRFTRWKAQPAFVMSSQAATDDPEAA